VVDDPAQERVPTIGDRDRLRVFADAAGFAFQAAALAERLESQRNHFQRLTLTGQAVMTDLCEKPVTLRAADGYEWAALPTAAVLSPADAAGTDRDPLLTPRELEVLAMITEGARNRQIAARLCVSEETVKSHVRRVLRKLHAGIRAEAVSRYHRLRAG